MTNIRNIEWIPLSRRRPEPWTKILVTYRVSYDAPDDPNDTSESWIEDSIFTATFYDDGIEQDVCFGDIESPVKYYFVLDDNVDTNVGLKKVVINSGRKPYPFGGRTTYEITAWAKLPEPYHKRTRKECPIKDISGFMDRLDNDDRNHLKKEDY